MNRDMTLYRAHLTGMAQTFCELIGLGPTLLLLEHYGGRTIQIAKRSDSSTQIRVAEIIGREAATRLGDFFNGTPFTVPTCSKAIKAKRNDDLRAEFDRLTLKENISSREAVLRLTTFTNQRLHERTIWRILNKANG